jgi:hypothetical protein
VLSKNAIIACILLPLIAACTAQPPRRRAYSDGFSISSTNASEELERAREMGAVSVRFFHGDFFSLIDPNRNSCAGDVRYYSHPWEINSADSGAKRLPASYEDSSISTKPAFVRNVSVDITDANVQDPDNLAYGCSFGQGPSSPPNSNCATFDYGALSGVHSSLQGSLLLFGGVTNSQVRGMLPPLGASAGLATLTCGPTASADSQPNACSSEVYALAVETLPANTATDPPNPLAPGLTSATEAISTWAKLNTSESEEAPLATAGSASALSLDGKKLIVFGGSSAQPGALTLGHDTHDTWVLDLERSLWERGPTYSAQSQSIAMMRDCHATGCVWDDPDFPAPVRQIITNPIFSAKAPGGRAGFGYAAIPNSGINRISANSQISALQADQIDTTDRIFIAGGSRGSDPVGGMVYSLDVNRFNPTFGPEYKDRGANGPIALTSPTSWVGALVTHWIDSSPFQLMTTGRAGGTDGASLFSYPGSPQYIENGTAWIGFAFAPLVYPLDGTLSIGSFVVGGGIYGARFLRDGNGNFTQGLRHTIANADHRKLSTWNRANYGGHTADQVRSFAGLPTYDLNRDPFQNHPLNGEYQFPMLHQQLAPAAMVDLPHWVHGHMVPGFPANDELVFFGGMNCEYAFVNSPQGRCNSAPVGQASADVTFNTSSIAYRFAVAAPADQGKLAAVSVASAAPTELPAGAGIPRRAAMAVARGKDPAGQDIVVAWGGFQKGSEALNYSGYTDSHVASKLYIMDRSGGNYRWTQISPSETTPPDAAGSQLVYSHVTGKYYLFGGYESQPQPRFSNDLWELTLSYADVSNCVASPNPCLSWRKLDAATGTTCSPNCTAPPVRRSHRMTEANYHRGALCTAASPCSFGIFMEGGTSNGTDVLADRWMFDPTANGGRGHWQRVNDFPPRSLAHASAVQLQAPGTFNQRNFAVLYGGQTGQGGASPLGSTHFVPPTLGDTHLYDFELKQWNRVRLAGLGIEHPNLGGTRWADLGEATTPGFSHTPTASEFRQYFSVRYGNSAQEQLKVLTPPPLAGAIQVVRTLSGPSNDGAVSKKLPIAEVYLFGGRRKDGKFQRFNEVYKFCAGSSGETLVEKIGAGGNGNGECDADEYVSAHCDGADTTLCKCYSSPSCDAFDEASNPFSPHPITNEAFGRWLLRKPDVVHVAPMVTDPPLEKASFMGAGAYDSRRDRILVTGGWSNASDLAITDTSGAQILTEVPEYLTVYEYTPPKKGLHRATAAPVGATQTAELQGEWHARGSCVIGVGPELRYGHSMAFDAVHAQVLIIGGFRPDGVAYSQTISGGVEVPQVWKGSFNSSGDCYDWSLLTTFGNRSSGSELPARSLGFTAATFLPGTAYNSGYYTTQDQACVGAGPIQSQDPEVNKLLAGGAYLDLNRDELGPNENVLLHLTYIALGPNQISGSGAALESNDTTHFKIHLVASGTSTNEMQAAQQPRHLYYSDTERYLKIVDSIAVLSPADGAVRSEQFLLPIASDSRIDRIRIERHSGSAILVEAKLIRMGYR